MSIYDVSDREGERSATCHCGECRDCRITAADRDPLCAAMTAALDAVYRARQRRLRAPGRIHGSTYTTHRRRASKQR
jgi:hypothetical protein